MPNVRDKSFFAPWMPLPAIGQSYPSSTVQRSQGVRQCLKVRSYSSEYAPSTSPAMKPQFEHFFGLSILTLVGSSLPGSSLGPAIGPGISVICSPHIGHFIGVSSGLNSLPWRVPKGTVLLCGSHGQQTKRSPYGWLATGRRLQFPRARRLKRLPTDHAIWILVHDGATGVAVYGGNVRPGSRNLGQCRQIPLADPRFALSRL